MSGGAANAVVLSASGLGKKFALDVATARRYGVSDILAELRPWQRPRRELRPGEFWAVNGIDLKMSRGEALGVIGRNGAGKTTLLKMLAGVVRPDAGSAVVTGRFASLIDLSVANAGVLTGRENILVNAALHGHSGADVDEFVEKVADFSELASVIDAPVRTYSAGMQMRLGFAVAALLDPDLLLVDEVLAVGDVRFQRKCLAFVERFLSRGGSLLLVSHDLWMVQSVCTRCVVLRDGGIVDDDTPNRAIAAYLAPLSSSSTGRPAVSRTAAQAEFPLTIERVAVRVGPDGVRIWHDLAVTVTLRSAGVRDATVVIDIVTVDGRTCLASIEGPTPGGAVRVGSDAVDVECHLPDFPAFGGEFTVTARCVDPVDGTELAAPASTQLTVEIGDTELEVMAQFAPLLSGLHGRFSSEPAHSGEVDQAAST